MNFAAEPFQPNPTQTLHLEWDGPVYRRFIHHAQQNPSSLAIIDDQSVWTYGELNDCSNQLAHYLLDKGIGSQEIVAVYGHRNASLVLAMLGILKAGAAFLILDPAYPSALLLDRLRIAGPRGWLSIEAAGLPPDRLETFITESPLCLRLDIPDTPMAIAQTLLSDYPAIEPDIEIESGDLAYIAFTSGTTGNPKAIQGLHKALPHFFDWYCKTFTLQGTERFSMLSGLSYDALLRDIFAPLWLGATLYVPSQDDISNGRILAWLRQHEITVTHLTPATIQLLSMDINADSDQIRSLLYLFFGGDILTKQHIAKARQVAPLATCVNFYGAMETPQVMSYSIVPNQEPMISGNRQSTSEENIPLGRGIDNVQLLVLNKSQQLADVGEPGEIYIRTPYLAKGYLGDEELTQKRFILNPFTLSPEDRLYRTGDLGYYLPDGSVEFSGRNDQQVKLRGYRIELGEIEAALQQHTAVEAAVVSVHENGIREKFLVAYLVLDQASSPSNTEWRGFLSRKLPDYMIPSVFVTLDTLPITPNGKIDRHALPAPNLTHSHLQPDDTSPTNLIVEDSDKPIHLHSLRTPQSARLLPDPEIVLPTPEYLMVSSMVLSQADQLPNQPAITQDNHIWTYNQLSESACKLARVLQSKGLKKGEVIAVTGPRSFGLIAGMLSVLLSGGVLLLIDHDLPDRRKRLMCQEAKTKLLLQFGDRRGDGDWMLRLFPAGIIELDLLSRNAIDLQEPSYQGQIELPELSPDDAAYIFFTSGTTGIPKGVLGNHKSLSHFLTWQRDTFAIGIQDRCAQLTNISFDVILRDVFLPLVSGATLCLPGEPENPETDDALSWMESEGITLLHVVPAVSRSWLHSVPSDTTLRSLRYVFFAGEPLTETLVREWRDAFPHSGRLVNLYGPTETTLAKCFYELPDEIMSGVQPVGRPLPETQALILTENGQLCGIGEVGEIVLRTPFRTLGYINDFKEQQQRFKRNPFRNDPNDIVYFTGDLGRYRPDGLLTILGRLDNQVKIHGVRIEPDEVAAELERHPNVRSAVVVAHEKSTDEFIMVAYIVPSGEAELSSSMIRSYIGKHLPKYMIPSAFVKLDSLPLTRNGKVDRDALPKPDIKRSDLENVFVKPRTPVEILIAEIWCDVLGLDQVGINDNFFELGGHSLIGMQIISRVRYIFGVEITFRQLLDKQTIANLAEVINNKVETSEIEAITQILSEKESSLTEEEQQNGQLIEKTISDRDKLPFHNFLSSITDLKRRNEFLWKMNEKYCKPILHVAKAYRSIVARHVRVVAVTGTYGKTTTTRAVKAALGVHLHPWTDLNANCLSLVPMALMRQSPFRKYAVVEVGIDGPWQMERYATALQPDIVVMTSIGNEHIQSFKNIDHLRNEKTEMVRALSAKGTAVLNGDDPNVMWMATQTEAKIITFGFAPHCSVFASNVRLDWPNNTRLTLHAQGKKIDLNVQLIGQKMIYPLLAATAVAITNGRPLPEVATALEALPPTPGRLQPVHLPNDVIVLRDDYKSTVETVHTALDVLKQVETGRRIVVLGDIDSPPSPARPHYRAIGERVAGIADIAIFVGKKFKDYRTGARRGGMVDQQMMHARNIHEAIDMLQDEVRARDVILVKGQGKQRLTRIVLALAGQKICCRVYLCQLHLMFCDYCPMLDRNWNDG